MGWIIANGDSTKFRGWDMGFIWVDRKEDAIWYARRSDAEKVHEDDEDAWQVLPVAPETAK